MATQPKTPGSAKAVAKTGRDALARRRARTEPTPFAWNPTAQRYRDNRTGRFVPADAVRAVVDMALDASESRTRAVTELLRSGGISLDDWLAVMKREAKRANLYGALSAKGGPAHMTAADYGRVGARIRAEYGYLAKFAKELADGRPITGREVARAGQYGQAGRATYHAVEQVERAGAGFTHYRNERYASDSCDGCIAATAAGIVPIGTLPPIGSRTCRRNCRCRFRYFRVVAGAYVDDTGRVSAMAA